MKMKFILFLLAIIAIASADDKADSPILTLTSKNFDEALKTYPSLFVKFYAPWCRHCQTLAPEFLAAAKSLKKIKDGVRMAEIDGSEERELVKRYKIEGYPTMKLFHGGQIIEYDGPRTSAGILAWLSRRAGSSVIPIHSSQDFEKQLGDNEVVVCLFTKKDSKALKTFEAIARNYIQEREITFISVSDQEVREEVGVEGSGDVVILYKSGEGSQKKFEGTLSEDELAPFIEKNRFPLLVRFNAEYLKNMFNSETPTMFFIKKDRKVDHLAFLEMRKVGEKLQGKILIFYAEYDEDIAKQLAIYLDIEEHELPAVSIIDNPSSKNPKKYKFKGDQITEAEILAFYEKFASGKLAAPVNVKSTVKVVTSDTFKNIVLDNTKHVLIQFHAPWCGFCQQMDSWYEKLAKEMSSLGNDVVLAKIDSSTEEVEAYKPKGYPTLLLYRKNKKLEPVLFKGALTYDRLKNFISDNIAEK